MSKICGAATGDLFHNERRIGGRVEMFGEGASLLRGFAGPDAAALMTDLADIISMAPFCHMETPGGHKMSVAMTNCGAAGWVTDQRGYRYEALDPATGRSWPPMPASFFSIATRAAAECGISDFAPDACLINRYSPSARLSLHQDKNERDFGMPIVSVSLGLPAMFLFGGLRRSDRPRRILLESGDVAVWGGPSRLAFHGVAPLADGNDLLTGRCRINLTLRKAL
ncbi:MAG: DNA oxidative demethylase AlkB [Rhodospirillales bacterium]|nr:DNA oxidative demethylase AlkB [Rhodospirillales bacterium]